MSNFVELTNHLKVPNGSHVLYFYEDQDLYINNIMAYIKAGVENDHHILIVEDPSIYEVLSEKTKAYFNESDQSRIHYVDHLTFYRYHSDFHIQSIVKHFSDILEPLFENNLKVRTWANVIWSEQADVFEKISEFERIANQSVNDMGIMSICAYPAERVPAYVQTELMKSHEYFMTDKELVPSVFYNNDG